MLFSRRRHATILLVQLGLVLSFLLPGTVLAGKSLLYAGQLFDGVSGKLEPEKTIVVEDGRIIRITDGYLPTGKYDQVIDLKNSTVLPGLIDMHTHLGMQLGKSSYIERFTLSPGDIAFRMVGRAERTLQAGFTTIRELGNSSNLSISLRKAIAAGVVDGPRIYAAGKSIATTGGHADPTNGMRPDLAGDPGPEAGVINGVADARKAVRQRYKDGADLIKITATGGVLSVARNGLNPQFQDDELEAVVATARDYGMFVAAHAHGTAGMKRAVLAGVRTIEHGTFMDDEVMQLMIERGTFLVPTMMAGETVVGMANESGLLPAIIRLKALAIGPQMKTTLGEAYRAGVRIAFGTDCGVSPHGSNGREFRLMVAAGMSPAAALESATRVAAEALDVRSDLGSLEAGLWADIIAVPGNPLEDITVMERVEFVMKEGVVYRQP